MCFGILVTVASLTHSMSLLLAFLLLLLSLDPMASPWLSYTSTISGSKGRRSWSFWGRGLIHPPTRLSADTVLPPPSPLFSRQWSPRTALVYHVYFLITETESKNLANRHQARNKGNRSQAQCLSACALGRISNSLALWCTAREFVTGSNKFQINLKQIRGHRYLYIFLPLWSEFSK